MQKITNINKIIFLIFFLFLLSGCGFKLRGMQSLPENFNNIALIIQKSSPDLEPILRDQFRAFKRNIVSDPEQARYWLIIEKDDLKQNIASISSSTTPRQYILAYNLDYKLTKPSSSESMLSKQIIVLRQLTINSDRILGSNDEENHIIHEMHIEAISRLFDQIGKIVS